MRLDPRLGLLPLLDRLNPLLQKRIISVVNFLQLYPYVESSCSCHYHSINSEEAYQEKLATYQSLKDRSSAIASCIDNSFTGNVPKDLGNLTKLEVLNLAGNQLTDEHLASEGIFPLLLKVFASACQFRGTIPTGIGNLTNLIWLDLGANDLTGTWDTCLSSNKLSGSIPSCFGDLPALQELFLDSNVLAFNIPTSLWSLRDLLVLNLSSNFLTGNLPPEVGNMKSITTLDLSKNLVSEFGDLVSLESLDLSQNNLSGTIPKSLEALIYLKYLNVSFNKLQGEIPNGGPFVNFTAESFMFNEALCGAPHFQVMACDKNNRTQSWKTKSFILKYILLPVGSTVTLVVFIVLWIRRRDNMEIPTPIDSWLPGTHEKISHQQLLYATNDFGEDNLIGKGSQGMVYKGVLSNGLTVAIKVFNLEFQGALRSFDSECEVMQGIRHRNLVRIITCCSNLDFKALVLEYMPNGSLEKWLYSHNYFLDLIQRLNIMIDVASALEYLHHDCSSLVVHCDLKPSNVLLDDDMVAHVADFGIAKLLTKTESMQQTKTLGTIGYMAPEHGSDGIVSTKSDVYSYGILLMEVFARKKPMDEMFTGDLTLKTWVESLSIQ
ncbi:putative LRR receptor-like serine/threonine-protein kinase [Vitis vinifera]|uniref:Putative LRR receptor-like serine/threonine-protein kinase n=1 Tax=Vitis vinifera TaxID=29760 RepID=A0A438CFG7_VITVI|nr:putative LRR receptor-like serine/threonine-protein kinase [Vitis vinifera]